MFCEKDDSSGLFKDFGLIQTAWFQSDTLIDEVHRKYQTSNLIYFSDATLFRGLRLFDIDGE